MARIRSEQDFGSGVVFILIGTAGLWFGRHLEFGTAAQMGPGFFPMILSGLIVALGAGIALRALVADGPRIGPVRLRPLALVIAAILAFGALINLVGLALTTIAVTFIAAAARGELKGRETLALGVGLAVFVVLVFVVALNQPLPAWWGSS